MNRLFSKTDLSNKHSEMEGNSCYSDASNLNTASTNMPNSTFRESSSDVFANSPVKNRPLIGENSLGESIKIKEKLAQEHREKLKSRQKLRSVSDDNRIKRITRLSGKLILVFLVCWFPNMIIEVLQVLEAGLLDDMSYSIRVVCEILAYSSAAINPIIYAFDSSEHFRNTLKACFNK